MASIDGAGRGSPSKAGATGRPAGEASLDEAAKGQRTKEKDRFGGLQKRKGALDKTAHATRVLNREQTKVSAPSSKGLSQRPQGLSGSTAGNKPRVTAQQPSAQAPAKPPSAHAATQAPAKPPSAHAATQAPTRATAQQAAAPAKPQRTQAVTQAITQVTPQAANPVTATAPAKPTRSAASLRRPQAQQRPSITVQQAGSPRTLPRTIMNVPKPSPRAATRTTAGATTGATTGTISRATPANTKTVAGYDILTNAAARGGGVEAKQVIPGHDTIARTPRPALRSPGGDKFLQRGADGGGGGFNPAATLGRGRSAGVAVPGDSPVVLASRRAQAPLPAPPRIGIGTRILNAIKNIFTFGAYGRAMASRAHSGRVGITLSESALIFASDTHKHLRHSIAELTESNLSKGEQETYKLATGIIRDSLKPTGENVLPDNEYHPEAINKVASALIAIDKIVFDHTGVAYQAPDYDRSRPPDFPAEPAAVSSLPDDRIYETVEEAQQAGAQQAEAQQAGAQRARGATGGGVGGAGGTGDTSNV